MPVASWAYAFDTSSTLSTMYLWLLFAYLSNMLNCDLQRFAKDHVMVGHLIGLTTFFFLFTLVEANPETGLVAVWLKTLFIYVLFLLSTKSKWFFIVPVLVFLLVSQSIKKHVEFTEHRNEMSEKQKEMWIRARHVLNVLVISITVVGAIHYAALQKKQFKGHFSWTKFLLGTRRCTRLTSS